MVTVPLFLIYLQSIRSCSLEEFPVLGVEDVLTSKLVDRLINITGERTNLNAVSLVYFDSRPSGRLVETNPTMAKNCFHGNGGKFIQGCH